MASEKNAKGRNLYTRLKWLVDNKFLPETFAEMVDITRRFRNWGAHDTAVEVEPEDVEMVDGFFRAVLEYIYVAPEKVA